MQQDMISSDNNKQLDPRALKSKKKVLQRKQEKWTAIIPIFVFFSIFFPKDINETAMIIIGVFLLLLIPFLIVRLVKLTWAINDVDREIKKAEKLCNNKEPREHTEENGEDKTTALLAAASDNTFLSDKTRKLLKNTLLTIALVAIVACIIMVIMGYQKDWLLAAFACLFPLLFLALALTPIRKQEVELDIPASSPMWNAIENFAFGIIIIAYPILKIQAFTIPVTIMLLTGCIIIILAAYLMYKRDQKVEELKDELDNK